MNSRFFNIFFVSIITSWLAISPAMAQPKPLNLKGTYLLKYAKMPIGKVVVNGAQEGTSYHMDATASLVGVAKVFSSHQSSNKVSGTLADADARDFAHAMREFQTNYTADEGPKTITLAYDSDGNLTKEEVAQTHEMSYRPKVTQEQKNGVPDTMTMVFALREALFQAKQNQQSQTSLNFFDGKRLTKVNARLYGTVERPWKGVKKTPVYKVGLIRESVAGHTEKELKRLKAMREILIYFTDDTDFKPILGDLPTTFGTFHAELQ